MVKVRHKNIMVTPEVINMMYGVPDYPDEEEQLIVEERQGINMPLFSKIGRAHV